MVVGIPEHIASSARCRSRCVRVQTDCGPCRAIDYSQFGDLLTGERITSIPMMERSMWLVSVGVILGSVEHVGDRLGQEVGFAEYPFPFPLLKVSFPVRIERRASGRHGLLLLLGSALDLVFHVVDLVYEVFHFTATPRAIRPTEVHVGLSGSHCHGLRSFGRWRRPTPPGRPRPAPEQEGNGAGSP